MAASTETKIELRALFATPVALAPLPEAETINPVLRQTILERERDHPTTAHSNLGGWQSSWDFPSWCGPEGKRVLTFARAMASHLTKARDGEPTRPKWRINAWANINRKGHGNEFHTHPGAFWSGSYYVDDGGIAADPDLGGEFEIQDPRGVAPAMYRPELIPAVPRGASMGASEVLQPTAGTVIMFPSWLSHAVRPYRGSGERISIAFNFSV